MESETVPSDAASVRGGFDSLFFTFFFFYANYEKKVLKTETLTEDGCFSRLVYGKKKIGLIFVNGSKVLGSAE